MARAAAKGIILILSAGFASGFQRTNVPKPNHLYIQATRLPHTGFTCLQPLRTLRKPLSIMSECTKDYKGPKTVGDAIILPQEDINAFRHNANIKLPGSMRTTPSFTKLLTMLHSCIQLLPNLNIKKRVSNFFQGSVALAMSAAIIFFSGQAELTSPGHQRCHPIQEQHRRPVTTQCSASFQEHYVLKRDALSVSNRGRVAFVAAPSAPNLEASIREAGEQARYTLTKILSSSLPAKLAAIVGASFVLILLSSAAFLSTGQCGSWRAAMFKVSARRRPLRFF